MPAQPISIPWRRYLRFSVRGLIALALATGVGMGWFVRGARIQRDAVAGIEIGGVAYDFEWRKEAYVPRGKPWARKWLVDLIGVDYFAHVTQVAFPGADEARILRFGRLSGLQSLYIPGSTISDAGLAHLNGLTNLTQLYLQDTQIGDASLAHLRTLTNLSMVCLNDTQVTDVGLAHLEQLINLSYLDVRGTAVSNAGVSRLKRVLPKLRIIH